MATRTQRVPAGVPTGGQFAASTHDEATAVLTHPDYELTPELLDQVARSARFMQRRFGVDADEVTSETVVEFIEAGHRALAAAQEGKEVRLTNPNGLIHRLARQCSSRICNGESRGEDIDGMKTWRREQSEREQRLGRLLTDSELDRLADEVRESFPPQRRPSIGFHRRSAKNVPFVDEWIAEIADEDADMDATSADAPVDDEEFAPGSAAAQVVSLLEKGGRSNHALTKSLAWDVCAEQAGAPSAAPNSLSESKASKVRGIVRSSGGAVEAVARWADETIDPELEKALFAPFGEAGSTFEGQEKIAEIIGGSRGWGEDLWDAAVASATVRRSSSPPRANPRAA